MYNHLAHVLGVVLEHFHVTLHLRILIEFRFCGLGLGFMSRFSFFFSAQFHVTLHLRNLIGFRFMV
jgi:hypothetical protein